MKHKKHVQSRICILGGGPGGATASLYLSRFGIPHVLVDQADFPRDKVCGESFDGRVYRILEDLSPDFLRELRQQDQLLETWNYRFHSKKIALSVAFPKSNLPRLSAVRAQLDHFLFQQVEQSDYAEVLSGHRIRSIDQGGNRVRLEGDHCIIEAELVILANGAQPSAQDNPSLFVFSRTYFEQLEPKGEQGLEVYYFDRPVKGCLFICPLAQGRYNVEVGLQKTAYKQGGLKMEELLKQYIQSRPDLKKWFSRARPLGKAKGTSMLLQSKVQWSGQKTMYVGSGAFCVNPITGLGVGNAMSMGKLAAEQIRAHYPKGDFPEKAITGYRRAGRRKFRNILRLNRLVNLMQRHFGFFEPILSLFLKTKFIQTLLVQTELVKGLAGRDLLRQLFLSNKKS